MNGWDIFRLKVYGGQENKLYTPKVATVMASFTILLVAQFILDIRVWSLVWFYGTGSWIWSGVLGVVFAVAILLFDRLIIVDDTTVRNGTQNSWWKGSGGYLFRVSLILFLAFITSIAVELYIFQPDIDQRINVAEKTAVDKIRGTAAAQESAKLDVAIKAAQAEIGADNAKALKAAEDDIVKYRSDREVKRAKMVEVQNGKRASYQKSVQDARDRLAAEMAGQVRGNLTSGRKGCGAACQEAKAQANRSADELTVFEKEAADELTAFDTETDSKLPELAKARDEKIAAGTAKLEQKLAGIRKDGANVLTATATMPPEKLSQLYGGEWKQSRGFMARFRILNALVDGDRASYWVMWGCRATMIIFGLLILGLKIWAPREYKNYFSLGQQARAGNKDAQAHVENMGYDSMMHGRESSVEIALKRIYALRVKLTQAMKGLEKYALDLAQPNQHGLCRRFEDMEALLHEYWLENGELARNELLKYEEKVADSGQVKIPPWPTDLLASDPRHQLNPWKMGRTHWAADYGWVDPLSKLEELATAKQRIYELYLQIRDFLIRQDQDLFRRINDKPDMPYADIVRWRTMIYRAHVETKLAEVDRLEQLIVSCGHTVPSWPRGFNDPRGSLYKDFCEPNEGWLNSLGWGRDPVAGAIPEPRAAHEPTRQFPPRLVKPAKNPDNGF